MTRSERAYRTVLYYQQHEESASIEESITDLLTDLLHLADEYGDDADTLLDRARMHYSAESEDKPEPGEYGYEEPALHETENV